jgi:alpha-galactosidase
MLDAGWFCRDDWEKEGGEWYPDPVRFPNGIEKVMDFIREKGMKPGIWLEHEVVGEDSPMKDKYPEHFFFMRHGKRIKDNLRYMLDFRNKEVTDYLDKVVDRFYNDYGVRYLKLDHNMEVGVGTDVNSDSMCEGLVAHNNAFNAWLQGLFDRYSDLIIENCSSGGLRMTYGILDKCSIQSVTDQEDYRINGIVASKASTALLPEQAGIWIYPSADADKYEVTYNMVNAMLKRMHVSGAVAHLSDEGLNYMREGIAQYKRIRPYIKKSVPVYPIGLASFHDKWAAVGYKSEEKLFISVWRRQTEDAEIVLPFDVKIKNAHIIYPDFNENSVSVQDKSLKVYIGHVDSACVIEADIEKQ